MIHTNPIFQKLQSYVPKVSLASKERITKTVIYSLELTGIALKAIVHYGTRLFLLYNIYQRTAGILTFPMLNIYPLIGATACITYVVALSALYLLVMALYIPCFTCNEYLLEEYKHSIPFWEIKLNQFLGFNANTQNEQGNTILHYCALGYPIHKYTDTVLNLKGINPNVINNRGHTPLINAARGQRIHVIQSLLKAKNIHVDLTTDNHPTTALEEFTRKAFISYHLYLNKKTFSMFISEGADYNFIKDIRAPEWLMPLINETMEPIRIQAKKIQDASQIILLNIHLPTVVSTFIVSFITVPPDNEIQKLIRQKKLTFKA